MSQVSKRGIAVTFYNNVYGKMSARKLAEEAGVEDPTVNYKIGDVIKVRVEKSSKNGEDVYGDDYNLGFQLRLYCELKSFDESR